MEDQELFKKKYRIKSIRLENWNYANEGWYFVTICTEDRKLFFGKIEGGKMKLNDIGKIVEEEILNTEKIRKNARIDKWVIMPNHVHMIVVIVGVDNVETPRRDNVETPRRGVSTKTNSRWQPSSLGSIINQIKSICTKRIWGLGHKYFHWQAGYYEHIIRDETDYQNIWDYIEYNPDKWEWDKNNPNNINK